MLVATLRTCCTCGMCCCMCASTSGVIMLKSVFSNTLWWLVPTGGGDAEVLSAGGRT